MPAVSLQRQIAIQRLLGVVGNGLYSLAPVLLRSLGDAAPPAGPHPVGVRDEVFIDPARAGTGWSGGRALAARFWYPAASVAGCTRRPVFTAAELAALEQGPPSAAGLSGPVVQRLARCATGAYGDAPPLQAAAGTLPVILYCHGLGLLLDSNARLCEHLASVGYLVVSVGHPGSSGFLPYPAEGAVFVSPGLLPAFHGAEALARVTAVLCAPDVGTRERATRQWCAQEPALDLQQTWVDDLRAGLDWLQQGGHVGPLAALCAAGDFGRVGGLGMSLGGSALAALAQDDGRLAAVVNLDGGQLGTALMDAQARVPMLVLQSNALPLASAGAFNDFHYEPYTRAGQSGTVHRAVVDGAAHMDFTDWTLATSRLLRGSMGLGRVPGPRMAALTADCCQAFFDASLRAGDEAFGAAHRARLAAHWREVRWLGLDWVRALADGSCGGVDRPTLMSAASR
jgi:predicted dienelactone hydrolase